MKRVGILVVVSGFSGAGKGTVMKELVRRYDCYALSVSATTRGPRAGEVEGIDYFYKTEEQFRAMIEHGELVEYARYVDHFYGTPKAYVEEQLAAGKDVILEIEIQGALKIKKQFPDTLLLFITPPSAQELVRRLTDRGTEDHETILARLQRASEEAEGIDCYDYLVMNDDLDTCVEQTHELIQLQHRRASKNMELINQIRKDLGNLSKGE